MKFYLRAKGAISSSMRDVQCNLTIRAIGETMQRLSRGRDIKMDYVLFGICPKHHQIEKYRIYGMNNSLDMADFECGYGCFLNEVKKESSGTAKSATHYQQGTIQPIQIMQEQMTQEQFVGYLRGNVMKYACRIGRKDDAVKDAEKIRQYAEWLVQALKGEKIQP